MLTFQRYDPSQLHHPELQQIKEQLYGPLTSPLVQPHSAQPQFLEGYYLGMNDGKPFGQFAFYENPDLMYEAKSAACLGAYECVDDPALAEELLNYACELARSKGYTYLLGPMEGSTWNSYRFMDQQDQPLFMTEPIHQEYYPNQWQAAGFESIAAFHSQLGEIPEPTATLSDINTRFAAYGLTTRHVDLDRWEAELQPIARFTIEQFANNFLYTPIAVSDFVAKYLPYQPMLNPKLILLAEDKQGQIRGLCFLLADLLTKGPPRVIIKTLVRDRDPKYKGLGDLLTAHQYTVTWQLGFRKVMHAFMKSDNASLRLSDQYAGHAYRQYALFGKRL